MALGGYLFEATLSRFWPAKTLLTDDGAMTIIQSGPDEFFIAGRGLTLSFWRDPDLDARPAGIAKVEEVFEVDGRWHVARQLNGDQTNQGRNLGLPATQGRIYRVALFSTERSALAVLR